MKEQSNTCFETAAAHCASCSEDFYLIVVVHQADLVEDRIDDLDASTGHGIMEGCISILQRLEQTHQQPGGKRLFRLVSAHGRD